jgi:hypothetical protein
MRMWMVDPRIMCGKHLLGEHVECHMFFGSMIKSKSINGYLDNKLFEPNQLIIRHDILAREMTVRGYNHNSPIDQKLYDSLIEYYNLSTFNNIVDPVESKYDLIHRCEHCRYLDVKLRTLIDALGSE